MKLCHISDLHLDERKGLAMQQDVLAGVIVEWEHEDPHCILITGDLYERKSSPLERLAASRFLQAAGNIAPVILVKGNHDAQDDLSIFSDLACDWEVKVLEEPAGIIPQTSILMPGQSGEVMGVMVLPWMDKGHFQSICDAADSSSKVKESAQAAAQSVLDCLKREADWLKSKGHIPVLAAHLNVLGAEIASGQVPQGTTIDMTPEQLAELGCAYVALGHIHKHQSWADGTVCYAGSPMRHDFGEPEEKGWVLLKLSAHVALDSLATSCISRFILTDCPDMHRLEVDLTHCDLLEQAAPLIKDAVNDLGELDQAMLRLRLVMHEGPHCTDWVSWAEDYLMDSSGWAFHKVTVEPVIRHMQKVRDSTIADAKTTWEKVKSWLLWSMPDAKQPRDDGKLAGKLHQIEGDAMQTTNQGGSTITLSSLRFRGLTTFMNEVAIDFKALGSGLIALVGVNGSGKTTVMEAVLAGLFRTMATRPGSLYEHCHGTDAFIHQEWDSARGPVKSTLRINAEKRTADAVLTGGGDDGDQWEASSAEHIRLAVASEFGTREQVMASVFMAQDKGGSFLLMPRSQRRQLFIEMLGLGHLQELSEKAKQEGHRSETYLATIKGTLDALEQSHRAIEVTEASLCEARQKLEQADLLVDRGKQKLEQCETELAALQRDLTAQAEDRHLLEQATTKAQAAVNALTKAVSHREEQRQALTERANAFQPELYLTEMEHTKQRAEKRRQELQASRSADEAIVDRTDELCAAESRWDDLTKTIDDETQVQADARRELAGLNRVTAALVAAKGSAALAKTAAEAPCRDTSKWVRHDRGLTALPKDLAGTCPLLSLVVGDEAKTDDEVERLEAEKQTHLDWLCALCPDTAPDEIEHLLSEGIGNVTMQRKKLQEQHDTHAKLKDAGARLETVDKQLQSVETDLEAELEALQGRHDRSVDEKVTAQAALDAAMTTADAECEAAKKAATDAAQALADLDHVEAEQVTEAMMQAASHLLAAARKQHEESAQALIQAKTSLDTAEQYMKQKQDLGERVTAEKAKHLEMQIHRGDWMLLHQALGKTGVQALEIDAAGPETSGLVNELLSTCYGSRFQVTVQTLKEKQDGGMAEDFDLLVMDAGQPRPVDCLSGGEKVIISEAVSLALAIFNARKSGVKWGNIFRDESASALDPAAASMYVAMLRKALELGGFHQCIFVAHLPQVYESADTRLLVAGGKVTVQ